MSGNKIVAYGRDWCADNQLPLGRCMLMVARKTPIPTDGLHKALCYFFPVEKLDRREEEDSYGWMKTILLVMMPVPVAGVNLPTAVEVKAGDATANFRIIHLTEEPTPAAPPKSNHTPTSHPFPEDIWKKLTISSSYRKLRIFSGSGNSNEEDNYDVWSSHIRGQLDEWGSTLPDAEKRRRVREALKPPALDIIDDLKADNPAANVEEYMTALDLAFGSTESGDDLYIKFCSLNQQPGERPSAYLTRLQGALRRVIHKGGIAVEKGNYTLLNQFLKGTLFDQMLLVDLHLRDQLESPPTYLSLLGIVRREEETHFARNQKAKSTKRQAQCHQVETPNQPTLDSRLARVEEAISKLTTSLTAAPPSATASVCAQQASETPSNHRTTQPSTDSGGPTRPVFCYQCGEDGHIKRRCNNPPNPEAVNRKLIKLLHPGNGKRHQMRGNRMPLKED